MHFHESPANLDWANMPIDDGAIGAAQLLAEIGNNLNMNYGCDASGIRTRKAADVLTEDYGYSLATHKSFNTSDIKRDLGAGFPLILRGGNDFDEHCILNWCWAKGHAGVCEGFRRTVFCETRNSYLLLWMNWGWRGNENGWFGLDHWNPTDDRHYNGVSTFDETNLYSPKL